MKLRDRKIQLSPVSVFDLDIILCHLINDLTLGSPINSKTVIFMNDIVAGLKLGKVADSLSLVTAFFLFFLFLNAENIALCNDCKL